MPLHDPIGCEPLRAWARLEPRARQVDFGGALQAKVHDPLWMLARQWQFGEFKGEDTGSAILARLARRVTPVTGVRAGGSSDAQYESALPLEACVERLPIAWQSPTRRASAGRHFLALLERRACDLPGTAAPFDLRTYAALFARTFRIAVEPLDANDPANAAAIAMRRAQARAQRTLAAMAGHAIDGVALARAVIPGATWADLPRDLAIGVHQDHQATVHQALLDYQEWFAGLHVEPGGTASAWVPSQLEYQFACTLPRDDAALVFAADQYTSGRLDWYAFDQAPREDKPQPRRATTDVKSVIPTPAEFAGMPRARWWQLEDAAVDLGAIRADETDVAKILVAEFALLYGNNWLVVPYRQPVGSLAEIDGIVVTDVFGWRTCVMPATASSDGVWTRWDFFSISPRDGSGHVPLGQHLFLPPVLDKVLESEPMEAVAFVRDEMSNMVWAVETRVTDGDGRGRDGSSQARHLDGALAQLERALAGPSASPAENSATPPQLQFRLGTSVPANWIPFVPVHKPAQTRAIRLQRASMPRFFLDGVAPIRPTTSILRPGLRTDDTQEGPLYLDEEEVPRTGVCVEGTLQRSRWCGGETHVWHGRRVTLGRGEGGSGLRFDVIERRRT